MSGDTQYPPSMWAQKNDTVYLTFNVECKDPTIEIEKNSVYFKGVNVAEKKEYEGKICLFSDIIPDASKKHNTGRLIELILTKADKSAPFWPSLTPEKKKLHWLKVDFNKMEDEGESGDEQKPMNFNDMLSTFSGIDGYEKPMFDDVASDSDDEELPDLE